MGALKVRLYAASSEAQEHDGSRRGYSRSGSLARALRARAPYAGSGRLFFDGRGRAGGTRSTDEFELVASIGPYCRTAVASLRGCVVDER